MKSRSGNQFYAATIPGCEAIKIEGLGHVPMSENYERFAEHLRPALDGTEVRQTDVDTNEVTRERE